MVNNRNLSDEYCPARIYKAIHEPTCYHPRFTDQDLGKPSEPVEPKRTEAENWMPVGWTIFLCLFLLIPGLKVLAIFGLIGLWIWAYTSEYPKYVIKTEQTEKKYQQELLTYKKDIDYYNNFALHEWIKNKPHILEEKTQQWLKNGAIDDVIQSQGWQSLCDEEVQENRDSGYIGIGEDEIVKALKSTRMLVCHQVSIESYYTADIVAFSHKTGKICVVEIDGSHHWLKEEQIQKDERRMNTLAIKGISTIRFKNVFAKNNPKQCIPHIQNLLS
jgi:very-short-patch-repair endonuclease